ncbi:MAG: carboxypeptidase regulatory-like domain-containing protein [Euryarchaeota archaeon]|nr:carboxypeptidase regulatory-like domain-containing protein [Euryarchaeota archaeon]
MNKQKKGLATGLSMLVLFVVFATFATFATQASTPLVTSFGIEDTSGYKDTYVLIPVNITNVQNGPIPAVVFNVLYDNSVLNVVDVQRGALTSNWKDPSYCNYEWGTRIALVYDANSKQPIPSGSSGSVVVLNCSVCGSGETSKLEFFDVQLAEGESLYHVGTASAKNGTFTLLEYGLIQGMVTHLRGRRIGGVAVTLTAQDSGVVPRNTTTNETGYYKFTNVEVGDYFLKFSHPDFVDNSTELTVQSGETKEVNVKLEVP